ncbi:MAG TPA: polymer-forming cytoskeletal protein [Polyangiaceae bacterium]|jgi:cytoskeletal protein CcmA (bactofilin family)|nr:polymer-forming cytoskeletal protein [Polyangiaceae bacterium]
MSTNGRKTLVEEGTQFKGSLSSDCPIEVKGRVEGDLTAPALSVSTSGAVHGKVKVGEMKSQGELAGEFDADVVQLSGTVKDNTVIRAKSLEVKLAPEKGKMQVIFGECELEVGSEQPAKETAKDKEKTPSARPPATGEAAPPTETNGSASVRPPA